MSRPTETPALSAAGIQLDISRWPIVITTPPARVVSDEELDDFLTRYEQAIALRSGPYVSVLDLRFSSGLAPRQRQMLGHRMNAAHDGVSRGRLAGTAMVFTSVLMRSLLTAIFWIRKSKHPTVVFASLADAVDWGERTLQKLDDRP